MALLTRPAWVVVYTKKNRKGESAAASCAVTEA
jgi:hypothetical protein